VVKPVLTLPVLPQVLVSDTSPHADDPSIVASLKRPASTLVAAQSLTLSEALEKQRELVAALKKTSETGGLTGMALHEAVLATVFAELTLRQMGDGEVTEIVRDEIPPAKKVKETVVEPVGGVKVTRTQNTGGFAGLEEALGINSNVALADGKQTSKKGQKGSDDDEAKGEEGMEEEDKGADE
jgi:hypothetical protein